MVSWPFHSQERSTRKISQHQQHIIGQTSDGNKENFQQGGWYDLKINWKLKYWKEFIKHKKFKIVKIWETRGLRQYPTTARIQIWILNYFLFFFSFFLTLGKHLNLSVSLSGFFSLYHVKYLIFNLLSNIV